MVKHTRGHTSLHSVVFAGGFLNCSLMNFHHLNSIKNTRGHTSLHSDRQHTFIKIFIAAVLGKKLYEWLNEWRLWQEYLLSYTAKRRIDSEGVDHWEKRKALPKYVYVCSEEQFLKKPVLGYCKITDHRSTTTDPPTEGTDPPTTDRINNLPAT